MASAYTDEMVERMREVYDPKATESVRDAQIDELVAEFGLSRRSVIGKLTSEGLYVPREKVVSAPKEKAETREEIVNDIAHILNIANDQLSSFKRANRPDLLVLRDAIVHNDGE